MALLSVPCLLRSRFLEMSHLDRPSMLIKNQNTSIKNADTLNLKMRESMINNEPAAFSSEKLSDELELQE